MSTYEEEKERAERKERWKLQDKYFYKAIRQSCLLWIFCFPIALSARIISRTPIWYSIELDLIEEHKRKETDEK